MKGLLATLIIGSGAILISTSVTAQETNSISPSRNLEGNYKVEFNGDFKTLVFDEQGNLIGINNSGEMGQGGSPPGEWTGYTQTDINYAINGEGQGDKPEGSTLELAPEQRAELENSSSPNGVVFSRF